MVSLATKEYRMVDHVSGPLLFVETVGDTAYGELVDVTLADGSRRTGQVLDVSDEVTVIQVFEGTEGVDVKNTVIRYTGDVLRLGVSLKMLGRVFDGAGKPRDGAGPVVAEEKREIIGSVINPFARDRPSDFIETGVSAIDGLSTLVRGQKLVVFSAAGLPANELAAQIITQARVRGGEDFAVVFAAMGITQREAGFFTDAFEKSGVLKRMVFFLNLANDPTIERIVTPRCALTVAEFLAFTHGKQVLVVLTDMTNYCEALRELSAAREEVPGRRGYPGYMHTDLATIYERAGRIKGKKGSITQLVVLSMPDDDITHPIPDLTAYTTEVQVVLSRQLQRKGVYPPIDVLPTPPRLTNLARVSKNTREDHRDVADQLYGAYAQARMLRKMKAIVGEESLKAVDKTYLKFADDFEEKFVSQGNAKRSVEDTLELGWELLAAFPAEELRQVRPKIIEKYYAEAVEKKREKEEKEKPAAAEGAEEKKFDSSAIARLPRKRE